MRRQYGCILFITTFIAGQVLASDFELLIFHNNDMHARFEENTNTLNKQKAGGFARTFHVIKEARQAASESRGPPVLFLNAGDTYTGTAWFSVHKWVIAADFLNLLEPDVASLGNHEFDKDIDGLVPFINAANFPIVAANLDFRDEPTLQQSKIKPSEILTVNGTKIGVIGYLTPDTKIMALAGKVIFSDEVEAVKKESEKLHAQGVNIIIALGHSGYLMDQKIAANVPLVDLVVGGHTNTFLWNGPQPDRERPEDAYPKVIKQKTGKRVPVVQAYAYTKYMGKLHTIFDPNGNLKSFQGQPIFLNEEVPQDQDALDLLNKYRPEVERLFTEVVGQSYVYLDGDDCRKSECNLGNFILDAFVDYKASSYNGHYWTDAPIAVMNGGAIRASIDPSKGNREVTKGDLLGSLPYEQMLIAIRMNGDDLLRTLEIGVRSNGETSRGEFLQVSGLHVTYDLSKPVGRRVVEASARCGECTVPKYEPVLPDKYYGVIVTDFLIGGGDDHVVIKNNSKNAVVEKLNDLDAVRRYLTIRQAVHPEKDERIIVLNTNDRSSSFVNKPNLYFLYVAFIYIALKRNIF